MGGRTGSSGSDPQKESECLVDRTELSGVEAPSRGTEPPRVDHSGLLNEDARLLPLKLDCRTEACAKGACGGGRYKDCAQVEELICLHDHGEPCAALFMAAGTAWGGQSEDLAANHVTRVKAVPAQQAVRARAASPPDRAGQRRACAPRRGLRSVRAGALRPPGVRCERLLNLSAPPRGRPRGRPTRRRRAGHEASAPHLSVA